MNETVYCEITVYTTHEASELVADCFFECGGQGVAVVDRQDLSDFERSESGRQWDYVDASVSAGYEDNGIVLVKGFCPKNDYIKIHARLIEKLDALKERSDGSITLGSLETVSRDVVGDDWYNSWKKYYKPIRIDKVIVCPKWLEADAGVDDVTLKIDPGMAFGTGEHQTTSMCIELVQKFTVKGKEVLDVGCGSGILGICAMLLGAKSVFSTDVDPIAITAAEENAKLNGVDGKISLSCQNLLDNKDAKGDIIFANIVADVLIDLSSDVSKHLNDGGVIILSGIINSRENDVLTAFERAGFVCRARLAKDDWVALAVMRA